jgi:hypothetical protein
MCVRPFRQGLLGTGIGLREAGGGPVVVGDALQSCDTGRSGTASKPARTSGTHSGSVSDARHRPTPAGFRHYKEGTHGRIGATGYWPVFGQVPAIVEPIRWDLGHQVATVHRGPEFICRANSTTQAQSDADVGDRDWSCHRISPFPLSRIRAAFYECVMCCLCCRTVKSSVASQLRSGPIRWNRSRSSWTPLPPNG